MSNLARRMSAADDVFDAARRLLVCEPYDVAQTSSARDLEVLAARLNAAAGRAEAR